MLTAALTPVADAVRMLRLRAARLATNAFAFTAFKSTEPYLDEYVTLNIESAIEAAGCVRALPARMRRTAHARTTLRLHWRRRAKLGFARRGITDRGGV